MNGEPFCYGSRLTVRQLLELRANGYDLTRILKDHPELRVARASRRPTSTRPTTASATPSSSSADGSLAGPGYSEAEAAGLPAQYRVPGRRDQAGSDTPPDGRSLAMIRPSMLRIRAAMTDQTATTDRDPADPAPTPAFDPERRATELAILDALRAVVDPEIGMNVVELALIKQIILGPDSTEIKMILTTPFCPYAGLDDRPGQGAGRDGRRSRRQGDPAGRALGSARRRPDVVSRDPGGHRSMSQNQIPEAVPLHLRRRPSANPAGTPRRA